MLVSSVVVAPSRRVVGVTIELRGYICPLTPLENRLRQFGGEAGDADGFVKHYLLPVIYPVGLTRECGRSPLASPQRPSSIFSCTKGRCRYSGPTPTVQ